MELSRQSIEISEPNLSTTKVPVPLCVQVKKAVDSYFSQLNGHQASGLYALVIKEVEKPLIEATLAHTGHNQTKAAKALGLSRSTLRKKMEQYRIG